LAVRCFGVAQHQKGVADAMIEAPKKPSEKRRSEDLPTSRQSG